MTEELELKDVLWVMFYSGKNGTCYPIGVFSSEETALENIPVIPDEYEDGGGNFWLCPCDLNTIMGSPGDRFSELPDRIYPVFSIELEFEPESKLEFEPLPLKKKAKVDRKGLVVVK